MFDTNFHEPRFQLNWIAEKLVLNNITNAGRLSLGILSRELLNYTDADLQEAVEQWSDEYSAPFCWSNLSDRDSDEASKLVAAMSVFAGRNAWDVLRHADTMSLSAILASLVIALRIEQGDSFAASRQLDLELLSRAKVDLGIYLVGRLMGLCQSDGEIARALIENDNVVLMPTEQYDPISDILVGVLEALTRVRIAEKKTKRKKKLAA